MAAKLIKGAEVAAQIREELKKEVDELKAKHNITPGLVTILVGEDPGSVSYVTAKQKTSHELGFYSIQDNQDPDITEAALLALLDKYNKDPKIHGILVQLPLPKHIDSNKVLYGINPDKDVDAFHPVNVGRILIGNYAFLPCTPAGCQELIYPGLRRPQGQGSGGGGPLQHRGQTHGGHHDPEAGRRQRHRHLRPHRHPQGQDDRALPPGRHPHRGRGRAQVHPGRLGERRAPVSSTWASTASARARRPARPSWPATWTSTPVSEKASFITPVPGGVGPMTITMLMKNTVMAAKLAAGLVKL